MHSDFHCIRIIEAEQLPTSFFDLRKPGASLLALTLWHRNKRRTLAASRTRVEGSVRWQLHPCAFFRPEAEPARQLGVLAVP